ncbi:5881_t:CDS:1, partial [Scutellospora calospora]
KQQEYIQLRKLVVMVLEIGEAIVIRVIAKGNKIENKQLTVSKLLGYSKKKLNSNVAE